MAQSQQHLEQEPLFVEDAIKESLCKVGRPIAPRSLLGSLPRLKLFVLTGKIYFFYVSHRPQEFNKIQVERSAPEKLDW